MTCRKGEWLHTFIATDTSFKYLCHRMCACERMADAGDDSYRRLSSEFILINIKWTPIIIIYASMERNPEEDMIFPGKKLQNRLHHTLSLFVFCFFFLSRYTELFTVIYYRNTENYLNLKISIRGFSDMFS